MARLSPKLRSTATGIAHWCPACESPHVYTTKPGERVCWSFDGNVERPSFAPSMLIRTGRFVDPNFVEEPGENLSSICHYFLTGGRLQFCGDSTHALAGQTVDLPDWPSSGDWSRFEDRAG